MLRTHSVLLQGPLKSALENDFNSFVSLLENEFHAIGTITKAWSTTKGDYWWIIVDELHLFFIHIKPMQWDEWMEKHLKMGQIIEVKLGLTRLNMMTFDQCIHWCTTFILDVLFTIDVSLISFTSQVKARIYIWRCKMINKSKRLTFTLLIGFKVRVSILLFTLYFSCRYTWVKCWVNLNCV